jgi:phospholipase/carboxylesterase
VPPLLRTMEALILLSRHLHPERFADLLGEAEREAGPLRAARARGEAAPWPEPLAGLRPYLLEAAESTLAAIDGLREALVSPDEARLAYRALRRLGRAEAALYPVASALPAVSRYFLEPAARDDEARIARLAEPARSDVGVMHSGAKPGERGGFSLYVPEDHDPASPAPLVMALHGGSGNGGAFLWSWLRAARTAGAILVAPTAIGDTWSLRDPETDSGNIEAMLAHVRERWSVDPSRLLLTGMSDGGTFALLSGLADASPFTHLAPAATGFHPMLLEGAEPERIARLPIYLMHGALDWMFDVGRARGVARALHQAGARLVYREIGDLAHTYPREENPRILDWLAG